MPSKSLLHLFTILFLVLSTTAEVALQREEQGGAEASGSVHLEHRSRQLPSTTVLSTEKLSQQARDLGGKGGYSPYYNRWGGKKGGKTALQTGVYQPVHRRFSTADGAVADVGGDSGSRHIVGLTANGAAGKESLVRRRFRDEMTSTGS